jgi:uncharacterized protein YegP (UPF0339 family)
MQNRTSQGNQQSTSGVSTKVYKAPWGWATEVYDANGKQVFSGAMYASEDDAHQAIERFLAARNAAKL